LEARTGKAWESSWFVGYWFPQVAVYDDIQGWDMNHYTGITETYNDLADYQVSITAPGDHFVWATGDLLNAEDIYSEKLIERINKSRNTREVVPILSAEDLNSGDFLKPGDSHTWKFEAENIPDFAFATSNNYLWDATSALVNNENHEHTWISVVYPEEKAMFRLGAEVARESIEYFSSVFPGIPFPYNKHISVFGNFQSGMEFPMMANDGDMGNDTSDFHDLVAHEIVHTYFPFYVNINEKLYSWMDESWTTIFGYDYVLDQELHEPPFFEMLDTLVWNTFRDLPPMTPTIMLDQLGFMHQSYVRPKYSNIFLLEIFEEKKRNNPVKEYINRWKGKHPTPYDFFFTMNDLFGENLSWYWEPWYFEFRSPDLSITDVEKSSDKSTIIIENPGGLPIPVEVTIQFKNGKTDRIRKSAYLWKDNTSQLRLEMLTSSPIERIVLGHRNIPDINPKNNVWEE
jgi:hypothetical protein